MALGFVIARHTAQDPMLIAYLVAVAIDNITLYGLERILYVTGEHPEVAEAVHHAILEGWKPHSLAHGLRSEVILPLVDIARLRKSNPEDYERSLKQGERETGMGSPPALSADDRAHWDRFVDRSETAMLSMVHRLIVKSEAPYVEADREFTAIIAEVEKHKEDAAYVSAVIVAPVYAESIRTRARSAARTATTQTAAALLVWKSHHVSFPNTLADASPTAPIDPFSGAPLRYKREGKGFVVYSVGATGKFDGGNPVTKPDAKESLTRYPAPSYLK
jgi:hypothetical protein